MSDKKYSKYFNSTTQIHLWKSNGVSEESIENITKLNTLCAPTFLFIIYYQMKILMDTV